MKKNNKSTIGLLFSIMLVFVFFACKSKQNITRYEYQSTTRGGTHIVVVTRDSITITQKGFQNSYYARETTSAEWKAFQNSTKKVVLDSIAGYDGPTQKRFVDAATFGKFIIYTKDSTFTSGGFDGGKPHEILMPLMKEFIEVDTIFPIETKKEEEPIKQKVEKNYPVE